MYNCTVCKYATTIKQNLQIHNKSKKHIKMTENIEDIIICEYCNRSYKYKNNYYRHKKNCKLIVNNEIEKVHIDYKMQIQIAELKAELALKELEKKNLQLQINGNIHNVVNTTVIHNNINNINNIKISKIQFLNTNFKNVIDINTFMNNYQNEYGLSKEQTSILLENYKSADINSCINSIVFYLKTSAIKQYKYLYNIDIKMSDIILPFILTDSALRSHFEKTTNGNWDRTTMIDNIKHIVNITNEHIFKHHKEYMAFNGLEKKRLINGILKESGFEGLTSISIPEFYKNNKCIDSEQNIILLESDSEDEDEDQTQYNDYETENKDETENEDETETENEDEDEN